MVKKVNKQIGFIMLFVILTGAFYNVSFADLPSHYQSLTAQKKQDLLWEEVQKSYEDKGMPSMNAGGWLASLRKVRSLFSLGATFDHAQDELPKGRAKVIHAAGSVGKVRFFPVNGHPFTGLYRSGDLGLIRTSLAVDPNGNSFTPGIALKFFVDKQPSINVVAMNSLEGQGENWNFFAKKFSTKIDHGQSFRIKLLECIFEWERKPANELPVSHLAEVNSDGTRVINPRSPDVLRFDPSAKNERVIHSESREDFRKSLQKIPRGPMYYVYGTEGDEEYYIGIVMLDTQLLPSEYGDETLFFQHKR